MLVQETDNYDKEHDWMCRWCNNLRLKMENQQDVFELHSFLTFIIAQIPVRKVYIHILPLNLWAKQQSRLVSLALVCNP